MKRAHLIGHRGGQQGDEQIRHHRAGHRRAIDYTGAIASIVLGATLIVGCGGLTPPTAGASATNATAVNVTSVDNLGGRVQQISVDPGAHLLYALVYSLSVPRIGPTGSLPVFLAPQVVAVDTRSGKVLWRQPPQAPPLPGPGATGNTSSSRAVGISANTTNHTVDIVDTQDVRVLDGQSGATLSTSALPGDFTPAQDAPIVDVGRHLLDITGTVTDGPHPYTPVLLAWDLSSQTPAYRVMAAACSNAIFAPVPAQGRIYLALTPIAGCPASGGGSGQASVAPHGPVTCSTTIADLAASYPGAPTPTPFTVCQRAAALTSAPAATPGAVAPPPGQNEPAQVQAYNADTGKLISSWMLPAGDTPWNAISSAGMLLVTTRTNGAAASLSVYDLGTRQIIATLPQIAVSVAASLEHGHLYAIESSGLTVRTLHGGSLLATLPVVGANGPLTVSSDGAIYLSRTDGEVLALSDRAGQPGYPAPTPYWAAVMALSAVVSHAASQNQPASSGSFSAYLPNFPVAPGTYRSALCYGGPRPLTPGAGAPHPPALALATSMTAISSQGSNTYQVTFTLAWNGAPPATSVALSRHVWVVNVAANGMTHIVQDSGSPPPPACGPTMF